MARLRSQPTLKPHSKRKRDSLANTDAEQEYHVESIDGHVRDTDGKFWFWVWWKDHAAPTKQPIDDFLGMPAEEILRRYCAEQDITSLVLPDDRNGQAAAQQRSTKLVPTRQAATLESSARQVSAHELSARKGGGPSATQRNTSHQDPTASLDVAMTDELAKSPMSVASQARFASPDTIPSKSAAKPAQTSKNPTTQAQMRARHSDTSVFDVPTSPNRQKRTRVGSQQQRTYSKKRQASMGSQQQKTYGKRRKTH
ncbi:hypothetical protein H2203_001635 [Taxawa tesnikishii (nom. ined.)]|nr:hypothetical protein H2203_001635 [Dothideales sp. JES 119]